MAETKEPPNGLGRNTRQRVAMLAALSERAEFRTPHQIHDDLRSRGARVGLTTVYRTLQILHDAGEIDVMRLPSGEQLYRRCGATHHHHLVCRRCSTTVEVRSTAVERWAEQAGHAHGFTDVSHTVEIFGLCGRCSRDR
jgi:Fur family transcriptional regulator, ferric uptake regulator